MRLDVLQDAMNAAVRRLPWVDDVKKRDVVR